MALISESLRQTLAHNAQSHVLQFWDQLSEAQQSALAAQLEEVDFALIREVWEQSTQKDHQSGLDRASVAAAPRNVMRQPSTDAERGLWAAARRIGETELSAGRVAIITVAGGQGTRLGFDHPKGMFPIGPVTQRSLFQIFAEQIAARRRRHQAAIPWLIMTSDATHDETVRFFRDHKFFGLDEATVSFFMQGSLPAIDAATGQLLMSSRDALALSPDGHGGLLRALKKAGLLTLLEQQGIRHVFYHQVDNPTVIIADPALIGFHVSEQSELTTNVVCKTGPAERMGVLVDIDGQTEIIEYSEMTPEQAAGTDRAGQWIFWAGNTAIHVFSFSLLQMLAAEENGLPVHAARKNVPCIDRDGNLIQSSDATVPNAIKMERFIFDALPRARRTLMVEGDRQREFNPVKNRSGSDSPETARHALSQLVSEWTKKAGLDVPPGSCLELSPLIALDEHELCEKASNGQIRILNGQIIAVS